VLVLLGFTIEDLNILKRKYSPATKILQ